MPFLDHELVELAAQCPPELKIAHGGKGVLKQAARRVIPSEVIDRPKGYFPVPALTHLEGGFLDRVRDALHRPGRQGARAVPARASSTACSPTPNAAPDPARRQPAVAARAARDVAAGARAVSVTGPRTTPPGRSARAGTGCRTTCPTGVAPDVVLECGWGRIVFGQTFTSHERLRAGAARRGERAARHLHLPPRAARARARSRRTELFLDPSHTYRLDLAVVQPPGGTRARAVVRPLRDEDDVDGDQRASTPPPACCSADPQLVLAQRARTRVFTYLVAEDPAPAGSSAPSPASTTSRPSATPRAAPACGAWPSTRSAGSPGVGERLTRALAEHYRARGRGYLDLSVLHDNRKAIRLYERLGFARVPVLSRQAQEPHQRAAVRRPAVGRLRAAQPLRPDHRRRGAPPRHRRRGARRRVGRAAAVPRRPQHRHARVAVGADDRGRHEPLRRQAHHPAHPRARPGSSVPRGRTADRRRGRRRLPRRGRRGRRQAGPRRAGQGHHRRRHATPDALDAGGRARPAALPRRAARGAASPARTCASSSSATRSSPPRCAGRPRVIGDGAHHDRPAHRARRAGGARPRPAASRRIPLDDGDRRDGARAGLRRWTTCCPSAQELQVRRTANLHTGGTIHDVTASLHPALVTRRRARQPRPRHPRDRPGLPRPGRRRPRPRPHRGQRAPGPGQPRAAADGRALRRPAVPGDRAARRLAPGAAPTAVTPPGGAAQAPPIDMDYVQEVLIHLLRTPEPDRAHRRGRAVHRRAADGPRHGPDGHPARPAQRDAARHAHARPTARSSCTPTRSAAWSRGSRTTAGSRSRQLGTHSARFAEGAHVTIFTDERRRRTPARCCRSRAAATSTATRSTRRASAGRWSRCASTSRSATPPGLAALGIQVGDFVALDANPMLTPAGYVKSRHLDDKAGIAAALGRLQVAARREGRRRWSARTCSSPSPRRSATAPRTASTPTSPRWSPSTTPSSPPGSSRARSAPTSRCSTRTGPFDYHFSRRLIALCEEHGVPHRRDTFRFYRSDAASAVEAGLEMRTALVGFGVDSSPRPRAHPPRRHPARRRAAHRSTCRPT